jgi:hypothetical protein
LNLYKGGLIIKMDRIPICFLIDDGCPLIHVYRYHWQDVHKRPPITGDGRPLHDTIPNEFLNRFCDVMERYQIKGKFSIVPAPAGKGDVVRGIEGFDPALTTEWLDTVKSRLNRLCDFCPEGLTHNLAVNLQTGEYEREGESAWSQHQDRQVLTPYLTRQLELLKQAGIDCTGITSPWVFGIKVEPEYIVSIVSAMKTVYQHDFAWYFLHMLFAEPSSRPWLAYHNDRTTLVSIPANVADHWWATIDTANTSDEFISGITDKLLTANGTGGQVKEVLDAGGWPIVLTHWQSLYSNGLETGLRILEEFAHRVETNLADRVEWMTCSEIARLTAAHSNPPGNIA